MTIKYPKSSVPMQKPTLVPTQWAVAHWNLWNVLLAHRICLHFSSMTIARIVHNWSQMHHNMTNQSRPVHVLNKMIILKYYILYINCSSILYNINIQHYQLSSLLYYIIIISISYFDRTNLDIMMIIAKLIYWYRQIFANHKISFRIEYINIYV